MLKHPVLLILLVLVGMALAVWALIKREYPADD